MTLSLSFWVRSWLNMQNGIGLFCFRMFYKVCPHHTWFSPVLCAFKFNKLSNSPATTFQLKRKRKRQKRGRVSWKNILSSVWHSIPINTANRPRWMNNSEFKQVPRIHSPITFIQRTVFMANIGDLGTRVNMLKIQHNLWLIPSWKWKSSL